MNGIANIKNLGVPGVVVEEWDGYVNRSLRSKLFMIKHLPYSDDHFTYVLMNFGPQLMSDPVRALQGE